MDQRFKIITPVYNSQDWIAKCIDSVRNQSCKDFVQVIVDDCSTDDTLKIALSETQGDKRFKVLRKEKRLGALNSHITGTKFLCETTEKEDIIVHLDGDDWLYDNEVLKTVSEVYKNDNCWATYGNYVSTDKNFPCVCREKDPNKGYRQYIWTGWIFSHLRTFKKFLWDKLKMSDLVDSNGDLFSCACDVAIMCPILEMAGDKVTYIKDNLYVYNRDNPLNDDKVGLRDQARCALEVAKKEVYHPL
jgi:glycosyltransferase involved in cell wall biosynthesis